MSVILASSYYSEIYQLFTRWEFSVIDIDECKSNTHNCNIYAVCNNTEGCLNCACKPSFSGDGSEVNALIIACFYSLLVCGIR